MSPKPNNLTIEMISKVVTSLAQVSPLFNELIPSFTTRHEDKLNECIERAQGNAGALFYFINKLRPFPNGNKRIALALLLYQLEQQGKWLGASADEMYDFAQWVASAPSDAQEEVISYVEKFIKKHEAKMEKGKAK